MKQIKLTQGRFALVDDKDFVRLSEYKWSVTKNKYGGYVATRNENYKNIYMHRQIMNAPNGMDIDHGNHNTLDNQRHNLRVCTRSQNCQNRKPQKGASSEYKGVHKRDLRWRVGITLSGKIIYLGYFSDEIKAAKAYDSKALELFGEFAYLNFPAS